MIKGGIPLPVNKYQSSLTKIFLGRINVFFDPCQEVQHYTMITRILLTITILACVPFSIRLIAQKSNIGYQLQIKKRTIPVNIDGMENDKGWEDAEPAKNFHMVLPMDTGAAKVPTVVKMAYDEQNLYLLAICYHKLPGPYVVESLRRDFEFGKNDNFLLFIDPFDDQVNGFSFGANAAGAQWDGIMYNGGSIDLSWDNKWISAVKNFPDRWVFEAAIPFKSIRFKKGITTWGVNFSRYDLKTTEKSSWAPVPRQFPTSSLAYTGNLNWDSPPPQVKANLSLIPYALGGIQKDYNNHQPNDYQKEIGADAKIGITSALNLDLTINPDFSQVDVDRQVTNLDRFELFFPERRQFFLENGDLFGNFGFANIRPFFSRRIGLNAPIQFGTRLSGKINKNWRLGAMDMQTGAVEEEALPVQNFAVLSVQRRVFARSGIAALFINKQSINYQPGPDSTKPVYNLYNRNLGLEYNLASANNLWTGKATLLKSFSPGKKGNDFSQAANLVFSSRRLNITWQHEYVGKNYNAEVGYVPRRGYIKANPQVGYLFFPHKGNLLSHGPTLNSTLIINESFKQTDRQSFMTYRLTFRNQSTVLGWVSYDYIKLLQPFDPTNSGLSTLKTGSEHTWNAFGGEWTSKPQGKFTHAGSFRYGGYYANGNRLNITMEAGLRFQPYVKILMSASYNDIRLPKPWGQKTFWLVGPRLDVTMTNNLYVTAFLQYNQQVKNMNLNTRLQWRYQPASDLFIVYTDNYLPENLSIKNRAVVLKWTYWWGI